MSSLSTIRTHAQTRSIIFSAHARVRMFEHEISSEDILHILTDGEIIEEYEGDAPCPSFLMLGYLRGIAHHVVARSCGDHIKIITVYHPDESWTNDRLRR